MRINKFRFRIEYINKFPSKCVYTAEYNNITHHVIHFFKYDYASTVVVYLNHDKSHDEMKIPPGLYNI